MTASTKEDLSCPIGGVDYRFRTPDVYDPARARRVLTRQRVRRPSIEEFRVAALAGVAALAAAVNDPEEGIRQRELVEDWYRLLKPIEEDEIDEPDLELRGAELARLKAEREAALQEIFPQIAAIEANLERHYQPYAELLADRYRPASTRLDRRAPPRARRRRFAAAGRLPVYRKSAPPGAGPVRLRASRTGRDHKKKLIIAAAYAFDPEGFAGGEDYTPACPLRGDSFVAQQPAGVRWLHVHPQYVADDDCWSVVRLARHWRDGILPDVGGVNDQAAWTAAAVEIVLSAWAKLREARDKKKD